MILEPLNITQHEGGQWMELLITAGEREAILEYLAQLKPPIKNGYIKLPKEINVCSNLWLHAIRFANSRVWDAVNGWRKASDE